MRSSTRHSVGIYIQATSATSFCRSANTTMPEAQSAPSAPSKRRPNQMEAYCWLRQGRSNMHALPKLRSRGEDDPLVVEPRSHQHHQGSRIGDRERQRELRLLTHKELRGRNVHDPLR